MSIDYNEDYLDESINAMDDDTAGELLTEDDINDYLNSIENDPYTNDYEQLEAGLPSDEDEFLFSNIDEIGRENIELPSEISENLGLTADEYSRIDEISNIEDEEISELPLDNELKGKPSFKGCDGGCALSCLGSCSGVCENNCYESCLSSYSS